MRIALILATLATAICFGCLSLPGRGQTAPPIPGLTCANAGPEVAALNTVLATANANLERLARNGQLDARGALNINFARPRFCRNGRARTSPSSVG